MSSLTALTRPGGSTGAAPPSSRVLILRAAGFLGWPTAHHMSRRGHQVGVVDNLCRRQYDDEMGVDSLVPIASLERRVRAWTEVSGLAVTPYIGDMMDPDFVEATLA